MDLPLIILSSPSLFSFFGGFTMVYFPPFFLFGTMPSGSSPLASSVLYFQAGVFLPLLQPYRVPHGSSSCLFRAPFIEMMCRGETAVEI